MLFPCIILCRKGSKSIKNKNTQKISGKSLFRHTLDYAKKSKYITNIVVSTDDKKIYEEAKKDCFVIYPRPKKLSNDKSTSESALQHTLRIFENKFGKVEYVSYLQVTEPFRPNNILDKCYKKILNNKKIDSCFAAYQQEKNFWQFNGKKFIRLSDKNQRYKPRQLKKPVFREDTGVALVTKSKFIRKGERIGRHVEIIKYKGYSYNIDINLPEDLKIARIMNKYIKTKL